MCGLIGRTFRSFRLLGLLLVTLSFATVSRPAHAQQTVPKERKPPGVDEAIVEQIFSQRRIHAPPLAGGEGWINTAEPVDLRELRGKFVLVDFWTFCCINCMHILPELKKLEQAYPNQLVVIGVHSGKFEAERDPTNITNAVLRHDIEHPIVSDPQHKIWYNYGVSSWPTLVLIDPEGYVIDQHGGELKAAAVDNFLKTAVAYYRKRGLLDEKPIRFKLAREQAAETPLRYPGKVLCDEPGGRLFIADSSHNRIVVTRLDGTLITTIGSGQLGAANGDFAKAQFNHPQGMALRGETLYIADTENHLIRKADLTARRVATVAGTGRQADNGWPGYDPNYIVPKAGGARPHVPDRFLGPPRKTAISSPWDLWIHENALYIAMAGTHQIWKMNLDEAEIGPYSGNGAEDVVDGPLLPRQPYVMGFASFAQPSGLASDGKSLFVADSEGSSIRAVALRPNGWARTVVGTAALPKEQRLFTFGDVDGRGAQVRLQHPLGIAWHDGQLYVADTYNNKIKTIDPTAHSVKTLAGTGHAGFADSGGGKSGAAKSGLTAEFNEPGGLSYSAGKLYVADTNNHRICVVSLGGDNRVEALTIAGLAPPVPAPAGVAQAANCPDFSKARQVRLETARVKPTDDAIHLSVKFTLPPGFKMNSLAAMRYLVEADGTAGPIDPAALGKLKDVQKPATEFDVSLPVKQSTGSQTLKLSMNYCYCQEGENGHCKIGSVVWTIPLELAADADSDKVEVPLEVSE